MDSTIADSLDKRTLLGISYFDNAHHRDLLDAFSILFDVMLVHTEDIIFFFHQDNLSVICGREERNYLCVYR